MSFPNAKRGRYFLGGRMQKSCLVTKTPRSVIIVDTREKNFSVSKMSLKIFGVTITVDPRRLSTKHDFCIRPPKNHLPLFAFGNRISEI